MHLRPRFGLAALPLVLGASLLAVPRPAAAQTVGTTYDQLDARVSPGTKVVVETVDGRTMKGRLRSLSESGLVFDKADTPAVPIEAIRTVSRRAGPRPVLKGLLVGLGAGACLGVIYMKSQDHGQACVPGEWFCGVQFGPTDGQVAGAITLIGAGIGTAVGALLPPPMRVVYRAPAPPRVAIAPFITPLQRGVAVSVLFR